MNVIKAQRLKRRAIALVGQPVIWVLPGKGDGPADYQPARQGRDAALSVMRLR